MNRKRIERDAAVQVLALERDWSREAYLNFGQWLLTEQPDKPNLTKIFAGHFPFFARMDASIAEPQALRGNGLLETFSVAELRKHLLPMRFLSAYVGVALDDNAKIEQAERNRIAEKLFATRHAPYADALRRYVGWLDEEGTPTRTIRLYLAAASKLCEFERLAERGQCTVVQLQHFLRRHPGPRASLFRWLTFGRKALGWEVAMPKRSSGTGRQPRTVRDLSVLITKIQHVGLEQAPTSLLQSAIAKSFGFQANRMMSGDWSVRTENGEIYLSNSIESLRVPEPMRELVMVWARRNHKAAHSS